MFQNSYFFPAPTRNLAPFFFWASESRVKLLKVKFMKVGGSGDWACKGCFGLTVVVIIC